MSDTKPQIWVPGVLKTSVERTFAAMVGLRQPEPARAELQIGPLAGRWAREDISSWKNEHLFVERHTLDGGSRAGC